MAILYESTNLLSLNFLSLEYLLARIPNDIAPSAMKIAVVIPNVMISSAIVHFPLVPDNYFSMILWTIKQFLNKGTILDPARKMHKNEGLHNHCWHMDHIPSKQTKITICCQCGAKKVSEIARMKIFTSVYKGKRLDNRALPMIVKS